MWTAIAIGGFGCYLLKLAGMSIPPTLLERPVVSAVSGLMPVALLAALVMVQSFGGGRLGITVDARMLALVLAAGLLWMRASFLVVVFAAAAAAAGLRLMGIG